jgi:hypothetical protein
MCIADNAQANHMVRTCASACTTQATVLANIGGCQRCDLKFLEQNVRDPLKPHLQALGKTWSYIHCKEPHATISLMLH